MLTEDDVIQQQELLKIYRTNLKHLVLQAAQHGGELVSPLDVINGINQARDNIARIKQLLRDNDVVVEDHPDDESSVRRVLDQAIDKQSSPVSQNDRSQVLRRAQLVSSILRGAQVLWVDDNPGYNIFERRLLRSLGIFVDLARSTEEALDLMADTEYDAIISDLGRGDDPEAGIKFLAETRAKGIYRWTIFYTWGYDWSQGTPAYAFALTERPDHLLHYVIDALERERI